MDKSLSILGSLSTLPRAVSIYKQSSQALYSTTPKHVNYLSACVAISVIENNRRISLESILMSFNIQPSPEKIKLLKNVIKRVKKVLHYDMNYDASQTVKDVIDNISKCVSEVNVKQQRKLSQELKYALNLINSNEIKRFSDDFIDILSSMGLFQGKQSFPAFAVAIITMSIESNPKISKFDSMLKQQFIQFLCDQLQISKESIKDRTLELFKLLRKATKTFMPWLEEQIEQKKRNKDRHLYDSLIWINNLINYLKLNPNLDLSNLFSVDLKRRGVVKTKEQELTEMTIEFVKEVGAQVLNQDAINEVVRCIYEESQKPIEIYSKTSQKFPDKDLDDVDDDDLFSDDELDMYIRTQDEVQLKEMLLNNEDNHNQKAEPPKKKQRFNYKLQNTLNNNNDDGNDDEDLEIVGEI